MTRTGAKKELNVELWRSFREENDQKAQAQLVASYLPLVHYVVNRLSSRLPNSTDRDELTSFGHFGLLDAMKKFDYFRGLQFETYAMWRIRGSILDGLRTTDFLPRSLRDKAKKIEEAYQELEQKLLRAATVREVSEYLGITERELAQIFHYTSFASNLSLDDPLDDKEKQKDHLQFYINNEKSENPQKALDECIQKQMITEAINRLSEKERTVVSLFYYEELNLTEIAEIMGLSPSRISQLHSKAIQRIRTFLEKTF